MLNYCFFYKFNIWISLVAYLTGINNGQTPLSVTFGGVKQTWTQVTWT